MGFAGIRRATVPRVSHVARERVERGDARNEHRGWRGAFTTLRLEEARDGGGRERVGGDPVDRVGRNHHEFSTSDGTAGKPHAGEKLGIDRAVVDGSHDRSILDQRPCGIRATTNDGCREHMRPAASVG
jgi:hypothetical protein